MLGVHAVAVAADVKPNHALAEGLQQHLGVGGVVAEIGDDQRIVVVAAVDLPPSALARALPNRPCGSSSSFRDPEQASSAGRVAADDRGRAIAAAADIMGDDQRFEDGPGVDVIWIVRSSNDSVVLKRRNGFAIGTAGSAAADQRPAPAAPAAA